MMMSGAAMEAHSRRLGMHCCNMETLSTERRVKHVVAFCRTKICPTSHYHVYESFKKVVGLVEEFNQSSSEADHSALQCYVQWTSV